MVGWIVVKGSHSIINIHYVLNSASVLNSVSGFHIKVPICLLQMWFYWKTFLCLDSTGLPRSNQIHIYVGSNTEEE